MIVLLSSAAENRPSNSPQGQRPAVFRKFTILLDLIERVTLVICAILLAVMTGVIFLLVITRNFLEFSYPWSEEITRFMLIWLVFLAAAALVYRQDHISLDLLPNALPPKLRALMLALINSLIFLVVAVLTQQSWNLLESRSGTRSPALDLSLGWVYLAIPVGAALMLIFSAHRVWANLRVLAGRSD